MLSQLQNLQAFVANHLSDIVDWNRHVRPDAEQKTSGDHAFIVIQTGLNTFKLSCASAYVDPPPGAPYQCKALGTVQMVDRAGDRIITGPKNDATWADISKHLHVRELTDALSVARRELAEAGPTTRDAARVKLAGLVEKGQKWGIAGQMPEGVTIPFPALPADPLVSLPLVTQAEGEATRTGEPSPGAPTSEGFAGPAPYLGAPILYISNPGEQISGMMEMAGTIVKVLSHDHVSILVTPDHSEPFYRDKVARRGAPDSNGRPHKHNCWDFNPRALDAERRLIDRMDALEAENVRLAERLATLEQRKKPGPKPKGEQVIEGDEPKPLVLEPSAPSDEPEAAAPERERDEAAA